MSCGCIYVGDYDGPSVHHEDMRRARKPHTCGECGRTIEPGEWYEHVWGVWDGESDTHTTCADCLSVRDAMFCEGYQYGAVWRDVGEHLQDVCYGGRAGPSLASLSHRARESVCEIIERIWEEQEEDDDELA